MIKTCIVTGGAGFIGSHLCERLINTGYKVVCVDNLLTGRYKNIENLIHSPNFSFINFDLTQTFTQLINNSLNNAHYVFHLASPASPNKKSDLSYYAKPIETLLVNSFGTYQLLDSVIKSKAKFLFASTSEVYGDPLVHPQKEDYWGNVNPNGERSCYDEAKRFGEAITFTYLRKYKIQACVVRIFNTYGPKMNKNDGRSVVEFICQALSDKPITIFGDGSQTRSYCYISDMVEGVYQMMFNPRTSNEVVNLGNPNEISIRNLSDMIIKLTKTRSERVFLSLPSDDPKRRQPDITKAEKIIKWKPTVTLEEGLKKTINYLKNN